MFSSVTSRADSVVITCKRLVVITMSTAVITIPSVVSLVIARDGVAVVYFHVLLLLGNADELINVHLF